MKIEEALESNDSLGRFLRAFERGAISSDDWKHAHHLVVAAWYLRRMPFLSAVDRIRGGILKLNASHGTRNVPERGYHETLTLFWSHIVRHFLETEGLRLPELQAVRLLVDQFGNRRNLAAEYYSFPLIPTSEARWNWVPPDLKPLPQITPEPEHAEWTKGRFLLTTDTTRMDTGVIHAYLARSYWAEDIPREIVERCLQGSLSFGVFDGAKQVAYTRAITDRTTYAYLCDVFVLEDYRGQGLSKWMMRCVREHPDLQGLRRWNLVTRDAHSLYAAFGFSPVKNPSAYMEILYPDIYKNRAQRVLREQESPR